MDLKNAKQPPPPLAAWSRKEHPGGKGRRLFDVFYVVFDRCAVEQWLGRELTVGGMGSALAVDLTGWIRGTMHSPVPTARIMHYGHIIIESTGGMLWMNVRRPDIAPEIQPELRTA